MKPMAARPDQPALNEAPSDAQKNPAPVGKLDDGPKINEANGAYLPASYVTRHGSIRTDN